MEKITIVTGLPRSGTSLMMQILNEAGLPIFCDEVRKSDQNNPKGYFELEAVKGIVRDNSFLVEAQGKVLKVVAPLPMFLDPKLSYRVVFMRRDMEEVLMSQEVMLKKDQSDDREKFAVMYDLHIKKTNKFFMENDIDLLDMEFKELIKNPEQQLAQLIEFLDLDVSIEKLVEVVDPQLYRNKKG